MQLKNSHIKIQRTIKMENKLIFEKKVIIVNATSQEFAYSRKLTLKAEKKRNKSI